MPRRLGGLFALALLLPGCAKDKCKDHPPAIEVTVSASADLPTRVKRLKVTVSGDISKFHDYQLDDKLAKDGSTSFVIYTGKPSGQSVHVTVDISATDALGKEVGWASTTGVAEGNGCNFWTLALSQGSRGDERVSELGPPDTSRSDTPRPDARRDGPTVDQLPPKCGPSAPGANCPDRSSSGGGVNCWPSAAALTNNPPDQCNTFSGTWFPSTGVGAATWFNGGNCGSWKEYTVGSGCMLVLVARAECGNCALNDIRYEVQENLGGTWTTNGGMSYAKCLSGDCTPATSAFAPDYPYTPQTTKIRIVAQGGFHLCVYSKSP